MTAAHAVMHPEPDGETSGHDGVGPCDSNDSDEESSQWGPLTTWSGLSIIDRVGLNSGKMSETDLENTFSQIALAFSCDQYTLKQRLQAEEHARNLAEENIKALKGLCLDSKRSKILQRLEMCMDILAGTVERISNTAEVLGAVHKEAHVSRAVELMVAHVENVRRRLDRHEAELEEAKKMILQQNSCRSIVEPGAPLDSDNRQTDSWKKCMQQNGSRRRVSMSFIPSDVLPHQKKGKRESKKRASRGEGDTGSKSRLPPPLSLESNCSSLDKDGGTPADDRPQDPGERVSAAGVPFDMAPNPSATPTPEWPVPTKPAAGKKLQQRLRNKWPLHRSTQDSTIQTRKSKAASSRKKTDKQKKGTNVCWGVSSGRDGPRGWPRPLCSRLLSCISICVLLSTISCICILWMLHGGGPNLDLRFWTR
uniref:inositol 1,4,5-triphosphate receptor associated 2 isoform X2 n=1 Tax=Doryrhamphus excisus TaxID=161450 RepID=UPI0025ADA271|nr:inositol 1,4,5-triphosphate receptor associated 2 isoform X2 [Doryrhamphus excisus]